MYCIGLLLVLWALNIPQLAPILEKRLTIYTYTQSKLDKVKTTLWDEVNASAVSAMIGLPPIKENVDTSDSFSLFHKNSITESQIEAILAKFNSPAQGIGHYLVQESERTTIDSAYVLSMFIHESSAGSDPNWINTQNPGNIICAGYSSCNGRFRTYPTWNDGFTAMYDLLVYYRDVLNKKTLRDALETWAPPQENDTADYIDTVETLIQNWRQANKNSTTVYGDGSIRPITRDMYVNVGFTQRDCAYWASQPNCQHLGTDYRLEDNEPVFAPVNGQFIMHGVYPEDDPYNRMGEYVMYRTYDNCELYSGHLKNAISVDVGTEINAGTILGYGRYDLAHTHIQLRCNGELTDFETYYNNKKER